MDKKIITVEYDGTPIAIPINLIKNKISDVVKILATMLQNKQEELEVSNFQIYHVDPKKGPLLLFNDYTFADYDFETFDFILKVIDQHQKSFGFPKDDIEMKNPPKQMIETVDNPFYYSELKKKMIELGATIGPTVDVVIDSEIPLGVQAFMKAWEGSDSSNVLEMSVSKSYNGTLPVIVEFTSTDHPNAPKFKGLILVGKGKYWLYMSLNDTDPIPSWYMVPSDPDLESHYKLPLGPYPLSNLFKVLKK